MNNSSCCKFSKIIDIVLCGILNRPPWGTEVARITQIINDTIAQGFFPKNSPFVLKRIGAQEESLSEFLFQNFCEGFRCVASVEKRGSVHYLSIHFNLPLLIVLAAYNIIIIKKIYAKEWLVSARDTESISDLAHDTDAMNSENRLGNWNATIFSKSIQQKIAIVQAKVAALTTIKCTSTARAIANCPIKCNRIADSLKFIQ